MGSRSSSRDYAPGTHQPGRAIGKNGNATEVQTVSYPLLVESMDDVTGQFDFTNPLTLHQDDWVVGWVDGDGGPWWDFSHYLNYQSFGAIPPGLDDQSDDVYGTIALGRANPSAPTVSVWNFLYELKDIPHMVKTVGKYMRKYGPNPKLNWPRTMSSDVGKELGDIYLNWTFGWDLYLKDIWALLDFVGAVKQRQSDLEDLRRGSLKKSVRISSSQTTDVRSFYVGPLYQSTLKIEINTIWQRDVWARVRYKPTQATFKFIGQDYEATARRLAFGHDISVSSIWNAIPWSWLEDWFTTAGDYFSAHNNLLSLEVDDVALMKHTYMRLGSAKLLDRVKDEVLTINPHYSWSQKKRTRWTGSPVIAAYIPNLGGKQLAILASLFATYKPGIQVRWRKTY